MKYLCDGSLSDMESVLDPAVFFRANRKYIINIEFIQHYKAHEKVKLQVDLSVNDNKHQIIISQETAPAFRRWMQES
ncbi:MAG: LytTR family transcriptional regulator DNA-binding domain-containing protein [Flavisolibacter sp.]